MLWSALSRSYALPLTLDAVAAVVFGSIDPEGERIRWDIIAKVDRIRARRKYLRQRMARGEEVTDPEMLLGFPSWWGLVQRIEDPARRFLALEEQLALYALTDRYQAELNAAWSRLDARARATVTATPAPIRRATPSRR